MNKDNVTIQEIPMRRQPSTKFDQLLSLLPFNLFNTSNPTVSVLRLKGIIGKIGLRSGMSMEKLNSYIEDTFNQKKLSAVLLIIDSPGGSPVQAELISNRISKLSKEKNVPVYSFIEDIAASGGYWLACTGDEIYALKSSIIGSIGVISSGFGFNNAIHKLGVERRVYSAGKNKLILDPFLPEKDDDIEILKHIQKSVHTHFIEHVKTRRKNKLTQADDILFDGSIWTGETALDYGLVDGIKDIYSFIDEKFSKDTNIKYINEIKESWLRKKVGITTCDILDDIFYKIKEEIYSTKLF